MGFWPLSRQWQGLSRRNVSSWCHCARPPPRSPLPLLDDALQQVRAVVQMQTPVGRTVRARVPLLDEGHKGIALRARRRIDMDVRGEPRIGRTQGEGGMKMPGFVEERTVQGHTHVSSSQARGCMRSRLLGAVCQASVKPAAVYVTATA